MQTNKRCGFVVILAITALVLAGCGQSQRQHYNVKLVQTSMYNPITPTVSNEVKGSCLIDTGSGNETHDLEGLGNFSASFDGYSISCTASAQNKLNTLKMTITRKDGGTVGESETTQEYGVVAVAGK